ncbi:hypothetical protein BpHYR1_007323 [Brachionus plicatilis]|uniref:Uncharacterized protein n=1 Tax=Brachionus plicatilis TaxID=10195 RepID=A0A3M7QAF7_BRAPC|nr:hypothetical protein BpHYR1_007323 [Brachionus plicatilis]
MSIMVLTQLYKNKFRTQITTYIITPRYLIMQKESAKYPLSRDCYGLLFFVFTSGEFFKLNFGLEILIKYGMMFIFYQNYLIHWINHFCPGDIHSIH